MTDAKLIYEVMTTGGVVGLTKSAMPPKNGDVVTIKSVGVGGIEREYIATVCGVLRAFLPSE